MLNWLINPSRLARLARSELLPDGSACVSPLAPAQVNMPRLERWREAVRLAGMERALDPAATQGQLSLLVPEDAAFAAFEAELEQSGSSWAAFCEDRAALRRWLLGHVLPQPCTAQALRRHRGAALDTLGAHALRLASASDSLAAPALLDASGRRAQLLSSRQTGPQRHLHVIDRVLQPAAHGLLDMIAQNPEHRDFLAALRSTGLDSLLAGSGPFTVLAPSNAGMARLAPRLGLRERELARRPELLRQVLLQHLLPTDCPVSELPWGGQLRTAAGEALGFSALGLLGEGEQLQPLLPGSDQLARNGRLHLVEQLLIPPSLQDDSAPDVAADELTSIPLPLWRAPPCAPRSHAH
ncbi:fasciclin domain-containing protein [Roseateles sp.]|uniref:fasciclin domain-containing protein n=1 Tax=Roseateles sp. TaxID=1971397 RepID=UPI003D122589